MHYLQKTVPLFLLTIFLATSTSFTLLGMHQEEEHDNRSWLWIPITATGTLGTVIGSVYAIKKWIFPWVKEKNRNYYEQVVTGAKEFYSNILINNPDTNKTPTPQKITEEVLNKYGGLEYPRLTYKKKLTNEIQALGKAQHYPLPKELKKTCKELQKQLIQIRSKLIKSKKYLQEKTNYQKAEKRKLFGKSLCKAFATELGKSLSKIIISTITNR